MASGIGGSHRSAPTGGGRGRRWKFGKALFDEATLELRLDGRPVHLERKPLEVLRYLLQHAGEVVTKEELAENLWPGRILTESVLTRCISVLRQALGDGDRLTLRTVHGFGYRLAVAPTVELATPEDPAPAFDFRAGGHPPQRTHWKLVERLGAGGHGEAWLARHDKTHEMRVFKFALDDAALVSLKREITLFRVLNDSLEDRQRFVRILEWNLEEPPYFLEVEYARGGNLMAWAESAGGVDRIPLDIRLEVAAQIADGLAGAHSVGVLHKDLKPSNVLIDTDPGSGAQGDAPPRVRLCDFGSGGVLDAGRLEALGITRMGLTGALSAQGKTGATPLYIAPEVLSGQPSTVKGDIYSLGVILYQLIAGDLRKPLAPGWELDVEDALLREDVAATAAGDPNRRLGDAGEVAQRLRSLAARHKERAEESAARSRADRAQEALKELRRTRLFASALMAFATIAVVGAVAAYHARNEARAATATAKAINDFLTEDVFRVDPSVERPRDATYEALLNRAAQRVGARLSTEPEAAGTVHLLLGRRFQEIGHVAAAISQYESAARLLSTSADEFSPKHLSVLERLAWIYTNENRKADALVLADTIREGWARHVSRNGLSMLAVRARIARLRAFAGDYSGAKLELQSVIAQLPSSGPSDGFTVVFLQEWLGFAITTDVSRLNSDESLREVIAASAEASLGANILLEHEEKYPEAEALLRRALARFSTELGDSVPTAITQWTLGHVLGVLGRFAEAEEHIRRSQIFLSSWLPPTHWLHSHPIAMLARVRIEEDQAISAVSLAREALRHCEKGGCSTHARSAFEYDLGRALEKRGDWTAAVQVFETLSKTLEEVRGKDDIETLRSKVRLASALIGAGSLPAALTVASGLDKGALGRLPSDHQIIADLRRVEGLLWRQSGRTDLAQASLAEALRIVAGRFGEKNWRTAQARAELALAANPPTLKKQAQISAVRH